MRHLNKGRTFHREKGQRKALMKALGVALFTHKKITTTVAKAKSLRSYAERLVTYGKKGTLLHKRLIAATLSPQMVREVSAVAKNYADRKGGYTRVTKLGRRKSDSSEMAVIEFVK